MVIEIFFDIFDFNVSKHQKRVLQVGLLCFHWNGRAQKGQRKKTAHFPFQRKVITNNKKTSKEQEGKEKENEKHCYLQLKLPLLVKYSKFSTVEDASKRQMGNKWQKWYFRDQGWPTPTFKKITNTVLRSMYQRTTIVLLLFFSSLSMNKLAIDFSNLPTLSRVLAVKWLATVFQTV